MVAHRTRAQGRRPLGSPAGETIVISDTNGVVLGIGRTRDALVDAIDVTTQKARTAAFFSGAYAAGDIESAGVANFFKANVDFANATVTLTHTGYFPRQSHAHAQFDKSMSSTGADFRQLTPLVLTAADLTVDFVDPGDLLARRCVAV